MYSRNRVSAAEQRYAENLPPVYGGSRFYRGAVPAVKERIPTLEAEPAVTPAAGIPVEYEVRPGRERDIPQAEEGGTSPEVWDTAMPEQGESVPVSSCTESVREEQVGAGHAMKASRDGGLASLLSGDSEEILLIVLILLLGGEAERAADVIVILLLLLVVR